MIKTINDVHQQFADYFGSEKLKPFIYLLSKRLSEGNICLPLSDITKEENEKVAELYHAELSTIEELCAEHLVHPESGQPFIIHKNKMYFQRYFHYETIILKKLKEFIGNEETVFEERVNLLLSQKNVITKLFPKKSLQDSEDTPDWQLVAAINAVINNFTIITGGPGTGKTTTVAKILSILFHANPDLKIALAAPTGKAATRMAESLKNANSDLDGFLTEKLETLIPSTIHRLLKPIKGSHYFRHNHENLLNFDVVIVDESSMIDTALFAKLIDAISSKTRLILLGDKDQLASVEAGSLFGDLCKALPATNQFSKERIQLIHSFISNAAELSSVKMSENNHPLFQHIIELKYSHRFKNDEGIGKFSKAIIENNPAGIESFFDHPDHQVKIDWQNDEDIFNEFIRGYSSFIKETDTLSAIKKLNQLRVLCAIREGERGLYAINKKIENYLIQKRLIKYTGDFYENRPIMITGNNYELELFNGDVGIIRKNEKGVAMAWFENADGSLRSVFPAFISNPETVYAMTIHKSQGSEFNKVLIILPDQDIAILTRELLYTAITRAREKVIVQAKKEVILNAANARVKRTSGIAERLIAD
jgi:exodeoxyribonuclease V alpha subunit